MDRKSILILVASFALMLMWLQLVNKIWPPTPRPASTNLVAALTNLATVTNVATATATTTTNTLSRPTSDAPESFVQLTTNSARYTFTSRGGGIKSVEFLEYPAVVACRGENAKDDRKASVNSFGPLPILALTAADQFRGDASYQLSQTGQVVVAELNSASGLRITKTFQTASNYLITAKIRIENQTAAPLILGSHEWNIGTSSPITEKEDPSLLGIYWYSGKDDEHIDGGWFANKFMGCFPGTPRTLYAGGLTNVAWGAVHNQFFAIALVPRLPAHQILGRELKVPRPMAGLNSAQSTTNLSLTPWLFSTNDLKNAAGLAMRLAKAETALAGYLRNQLSPGMIKVLQDHANGGAPVSPSVLVDELNRIISQQSIYADNRTFFADFALSPRTRRLIEEQPGGNDLVRLNRLLLEEVFSAELLPSPLGYQASLSYAPLTLAPQQVLEHEFLIYAGPREYNTLARIGGQLKNDFDAIMGFGFFGFFAKALLLSMNWLHSMGLSYALAIIVITVIIKLLFWPLTNASTKSMKRMAALQPQMKAIQEKFKEDPAKMNRRLMEFMKENRVSPLGGCLPMLLQLPVFFGFFTMIRSAIELRGSRFLWVCDLSQPDTLFVLPGFGVPFNLLPLIMGVTMLWQARLTPPSPGMDPAQQKIMRYMPLMFLVILYNFSAGLTLYWTVQNLLTIAQMKLTRARDNNAPAAPASPGGKPRPQLSPPTRKKK